MSLLLPLKPSGTLTLGDVVRYSYFHSFWRNRFMGPVVAFSLFVTASTLLVPILDPTALSGETNWVGMAFPPLWSGFILLLPVWQAWAQYQKTPGLREPIHFRIGEEGVHCDATGASGNIQWSRLDSVRETGSTFFVYHSPYMAWVLPKRWFGGDAEMAEFRRLAAAGLAKPKLLKPPGWLSAKL